MKSSLDQIVTALDIPIAGIDLGGILWLVKCIIIACLDMMENFTDGTINYGVLEEIRMELQET